MSRVMFWNLVKRYRARPAAYLAKQLERPVQLRTVDSWEGLAKSLANGETDIALMGPWGFVLANHQAGAQLDYPIIVKSMRYIEQ